MKQSGLGVFKKALLQPYYNSLNLMKQTPQQTFVKKGGATYVYQNKQNYVQKFIQAPSGPSIGQKLEPFVEKQNSLATSHFTF